MGRYRWISKPGSPFRADRYLDVGINADGSLHNPNGYPEVELRDAIVKMEAHEHAKRSAAAKKAAITRRRRVERKVYAAANKLLAGGKFSSSNFCQICGKRVTDKTSEARGIGPDCWQDILTNIQARSVVS
jgi:hypothetical protein